MIQPPFKHPPNTQYTHQQVANSYIRPTVATYLGNLQRAVEGSKLSILRSDGGLSSEENATRFPVNLLMSGPAGGVAGAVWISEKCGFKNLLTLDMGGTSADVALIEGGVPKRRKETRVGDVSVRAQALDVHTVGAGGGSIAHVPQLTSALRVGPESAGAVPGPACYGHGGTEPTVTDANVVLGYLPSALLGGEFRLDVAASRKAVQKVADRLGMSVQAAAKGVVDIVNEKMFGALRLVSVEQGYDPRDFALVSFGGAGSLHANAVAKLMGSWPVLVPPSPGVLCAFGDATTRTRNDCSRSFVKRFVDTDAKEVLAILWYVHICVLGCMYGALATVHHIQPPRAHSTTPNFQHSPCAQGPGPAGGGAAGPRWDPARGTDHHVRGGRALQGPGAHHAARRRRGAAGGGGAHVVRGVALR